MFSLSALANIVDAPPTNSDVHLFSYFSIPETKSRLSEIRNCLARNVANIHISAIHLLNDRMYKLDDIENPFIPAKTGSFFAASSAFNLSKIRQSVIPRRLTFDAVSKYVRENNIVGYIIIANLDIFFDDSLSGLRRCDLHTKRAAFAQLRIDVSRTRSDIFGPHFDSQDAWIFHSSHFFEESQERALNIIVGTPGSDHKIAYMLMLMGFEVINDPLFIHTRRIHRETPSAPVVSMVVSPLACVIPARIALDTIVSSRGINLADVLKSSRGLSRIVFDDNTRICYYIAAKLALGQPFIIPRICSTENNLAVFARKFSSNGNSLSTQKYLDQFSPIIKRVAGVDIPNYATMVVYSEMYLDAFAKCEIFAAWESWSEYMPVMEDSHKYVMDTYGNSRSAVWAGALDISNYIRAFPWTLALRGKRILVVSYLADSIRAQVSMREKIYGIDLFPECEITVVDSPKIDRLPLRAFAEEFAELTEMLDAVAHTYDVALLSCGGFGNPVCAHLFSKGKSAINVGDALPMAFGVLSEKAVRDAPDAVKLYRNEHWIYPDRAEFDASVERTEVNERE